MSEYIVSGNYVAQFLILEIFIVAELCKNCYIGILL